jgi:hypothetical protein
MFDNPKRRKMEEFLKILISFIAGFITAVFADPLRKWFYRPKVKLSFGETSDYISKTPESRKDSEGNESVGEAYYIRGRVVNESNILARSCKVYLINIEKKNNRSGNFELTSYSDSIPLKWSAQDSASSYSPIDLPKGVNQYFDLFVTRDDSPHFDPQICVKPFGCGSFRTTLKCFDNG